MSEALQEQVPVEKQKGKKGAGTGDALADFAHEIQNMSKVKVLNFASKLVDDGDLNDFRLGLALGVIGREKWYEGHDSLGAFTQTLYGFGERKAYYLIETSEALVKSGIPWEKVKHLGWTKLKELAKILTQENVDEWAAKAAGVTVLELQALVKASLGGAEAANGAGITGTDETQTFKVKLKNDQIETVRSALAKAKAELNTEYDSVALEAISAGFLGGTISAASQDPTTFLKALGWAKVIEMLDQVWPEITWQAQVPQAWLEAAEKGA
jgi:hypothetical protein